jgi:hypothetical protein
LRTHAFVRNTRELLEWCANSQLYKQAHTT